MSNLYSFIGTFEVISGVIDVADPYVNSMSVAIEKIPYANEKMIKARRVLSGVYESYHIIDDDTDEIKGLLIIHCGYALADLKKEKNLSNLGYVSSGLSSAVVLVDEMFRFDTRYCYNPLELDAYYDGKLIIKELPNMLYNDEIKTQLEDVVKNIIKQEDMAHPKGSDIIGVLATLPIWKGFRDFKLNSSQWSIDVIGRLSNSYSNSAIIKGGVVSISPGGYLSCYNYRNHRGDTYAMYISFKMTFSENTKGWNNSNIPKFDDF